MQLNEGTGEFLVRCPCGFQFLRSFLQLASGVNESLHQQGDAPLEVIDVRGRPDTGRGPDALAELGRQSLLQLPDSCGKPLVALQSVARSVWSEHPQRGGCAQRHATDGEPPENAPILVGNATILGKVVAVLRGL